ncbi:substrate-binding domain-containing protein [Haloarcula litorea]|uniref:substrate-binding domain-containing protein n=1 Tax=Haloarcula litorea TaxID=3032579 RepID=UPI0023E7D77E|nr:substrate-binding domain-containing protein [Halomicroarcula sp. GDY20]
MSGVNRRNFMKFAGGAMASAALAGCSGDGNDGGNGGNGGGNGSTDGDGTSGGSGGMQDGTRPLKWMGPAWGVRGGQGDKYTEVTGIETSITNAAIPETTRRILSGGRSNFDIVSNDSPGGSAMVLDNDATYAVSPSDLDRWESEYISDFFTNPVERVSYLDGQAEAMNELIYEDPETMEDLRWPPYVYAFDGPAYNPKHIDEVSEWSALFADEYQGRVALDAIPTVVMGETVLHLFDNDMIDIERGNLNNPSKDQIDTIIDFLIKEKQEGQFRSTWTSYGESVTLMASEEAWIGDLYRPACIDVRREGTPCEYANMTEGVQGYRSWFGGMAPLKPGANERNNVAEATELLDMHYGAWFPGFIQQWEYCVPHYPNTDLVRDGSDETGQGMGPEYYDWAYRGERTYESVEQPALFDPMEYDWSMEESDPSPDGQKRDGPDIETRIDSIGFIQKYPDNAEYMNERWADFESA